MKKLFLMAILFMTLLEERAKGSEIITNIPSDFKDSGALAFKKESVPFWALTASSTLLLWYFDEDLIHWSRHIGEQMNHDYKDRKFIPLRIFGLPIQLPDNFNTGLYFLGDGLTLVFFNAGFYAYSWMKEDSKAFSVAKQLTEGMIVQTLMNQMAKRTFGRESEKVKTHYRGRWKLFPSPKTYQSHVAQHDAFPSGHVANLTTAMVILQANYPESAYWIKPVSCVLIGTLSFAMMVNGVHWASDYPLAIGMGYVVGRVISERARKEGGGNKWSFFPFLQEGHLGLGAVKSF